MDLNNLERTTMSNYNHTFKVLKAMPHPAEGYENPTISSLLSNETSAVTIELRNASLSSGRLYEIENGKNLEINDANALSVFVGNNVSSLNLKNCAALKAIEFADPKSIISFGKECFHAITNEIVFDLSSFTNLSVIPYFCFGEKARFPENRIIIPSSVVSNGSTVYPFDNITSSITEIDFRPIDGTKFDCTMFKFKGHDIVSSFIFNDNAFDYIIKRKNFITDTSDTNSTKRPYRKLLVETLSNLHNASDIKEEFHSKTRCSLSGDIYTFSNFPLSDLEDQDSTVFNAYLSVIPNEKFISIGMAKTFNLSGGLSVWVPTALYETWIQEWPNYCSCVYPYGEYEDRRSMRDLTMTPDKSYVIAPQTHKSLTVKNQTGPTNVTVTAYDVDTLEVEGRDIHYAADAQSGTYCGLEFKGYVEVAYPASAVVQYSRSSSGPWQSEELGYLNAGQNQPVWYKITADGFKTVIDYKNVNIDPKELDSSMVWLYFPTGQYVYDGTPKTPEYRYVDGNPSIITEDDFDVEFVNNIGPGTAKAIFTGKNNYTGTVEEEFEILPN